MSIHPPQLRELIEETLSPAGLWSYAAEELLMGTAAQESHLGTYLKQIKGPAIGIFQCEPLTHNDLWSNYILREDKKLLRDMIALVCNATVPDAYALAGDLRYQIVMARVHYLRVPHPLPAADDLRGQSFYWDKHYNKNPEKGFPAEYRDNYRRYVKG